jgi:monoamine oxidase
MPTLFTSLLARKTGKRTLAPRNQRPPVPKETEKLTAKQYIDHVAENYAGSLRGLVKVEPPARSIAIIGAGLAGLSAAYELRIRGYRVSVFEASDRTGGRTWSNHELITHHVMERGAELIGANHPLWLNYADAFDLGFSDVKDYENSPICLGETPLSARRADSLFDQMKEAFDFISARSKTIIDAFQPWTDSAAPALDEQNVHDFVMRTKWDRLCKKAILQQLESDNGVPAQTQSLLGLLAMVKGGGMERYWEDAEVYRCRRGAQALSHAFEAALCGMGVSVHCKTPVTGVDASGAKIKLSTNLTEKLPDFDDVILAIPPSAWHTVRSWTPEPLSDFMSAPRPQMGKNTKALLAFRHRFWKSEGKAPSSTQNGPADQTWETTEDYKKPKFGMVAFSGADNAAELSKLSDSAALNRVTTQLEETYKTLSAKVVASTFENWPTRDWTWASYSFPARGDILTWGPKFSEGFAGRLHFAGEHTCYAFTGYMEGALQSGYRLARKLVLRDGRQWTQPKIALRPLKKTR